MGKGARLGRVRRIDIPVVEASGAASRIAADGSRHVLVIGDRTAEVASGVVDDETGDITWRVVDLADVDAWPDMQGDSQFESIAADGAATVAVMREDPPVVLVADVDERRLLCRITLGDEPALVGMWDEANSRGEGLAFLRGGRLLVAKEKHPPALVEFAPDGVEARGIGPDDFLGPSERWESPSGEVTFRAVAVWPLVGEAERSMRDISAVGGTDHGDIWLLSDRSRSIARLRLDPPLPPGGCPIEELDEIVRLPKRSHKPEGLARLRPGELLVCLDTDSTEQNGLVVRTPD